MKRLILSSVLGLSLVAGTALPAFAGEKPPPPPKDDGPCNAGRGNLSEGSDAQLLNPHEGEIGPGIFPTVDCDPGNSGAVNSGGD